MFAYCNNDPTNLADPLGTVPTFPVCIGKDRYSYITDQEKEPVGSKGFGIATVSHGGCGAVASYNAMISLGNPMSFDSVLDYYNRKMLSTLGWGCIGLRPFDIVSFFIDQGYSVIIATDSTAIDTHSQSADACIMYYEFPATYLGFIPAYGAHFVEFHKIGNSYQAMNTSAIGGISVFETPSDYGSDRSRYNAVGIFIYK